MQSDVRLSIPRLVIGAPHGRSGKTTATLALVGAFRARGLAVQPFKKGPDYIDPSWLGAAANRPARNLDPYMLPNDALISSVVRAGRSADLVLVEGNHGLFDSLDDAGSGSTAALARLLNAPILLVVDGARMGRSVAALVEGYRHFEPDTPLAGVLLNNVASARHADKLKRAIEQHGGLPVVGMLPRDPALSIGDRHLGLIPRGEYATRARAPLDAMRRAAEEHIDLDSLLSIARAAPSIDVSPSAEGERGVEPEVHAPLARIGVVRDAAFTFYYPENLEALQNAGAELVFVDALRDPALPPVDALYIGGGFPEVFAEQLEANASMRADIRQAIENDLPVYAECGGLMYLAHSLEWQGKKWEMVGALPGEVEIMDRPQGHGYVALQTVGENPFFGKGTRLRGHEFHNSRLNLADLDLSDPAGIHFAFQVSRGHGIDGTHDGLVYKNVLATYTHQHALGTPEWARALVARARGRGDGP